MKNIIYIILILPILALAQNPNLNKFYQDGDLIFTFNAGRGKIYKISETEFTIINQTEAGTASISVLKSTIKEMQDVSNDLKDSKVGEVIKLKNAEITASKTNINSGVYFVFNLNDDKGVPVSLIFNVVRLKKFIKLKL